MYAAREGYTKIDIILLSQKGIDLSPKSVLNTE